MRFTTRRRTDATDFRSFIETRVDHWPHEYVTGKKLIVVWADEDDRMYAVPSPILAQILRLCSGAISLAPSALAAPAGPCGEELE